MYFRSADKELGSRHSVLTTSKKRNKLKNQRLRKHRVTEQTTVPGIGGRRADTGSRLTRAEAHAPNPLPALGVAAPGPQQTSCRRLRADGPQNHRFQGDPAGRRGASPPHSASRTLPGARSVSSGDTVGKEPFLKCSGASVLPNKGAHRCGSVTGPTCAF